MAIKREVIHYVRGIEKIGGRNSNQYETNG